jgi:transcription elongation factor GreA
MIPETSFLTSEGLQRMQRELDYLTGERRRDVARRLHEALPGGDVLENAELEAARREQAFLEGRIIELRSLLSSATLIEDNGHSPIVAVGSYVTITELGNGDHPEKYRIVGSAEADPSRGRISNRSPLGEALIGRAVGDRVTISAPGGEIAFDVREIG